MNPWISQPMQIPRTDSDHISTRQIRQMVSGSVPRMPLFVMTIIENDSTRPSDQAKRFGLAETQSGGWRLMSARATKPMGLYLSPTVTRIRNSKKKKVVTTWMGTYSFAKYA